jgi:hypothetical protein
MRLVWFALNARPSFARLDSRGGCPYGVVRSLLAQAARN